MRRLRPGVVLSVLLHLGFAALVVLASLGRDKPPEPLPPPSYDVQFEGGAPDRPAEHEAEASPPTEPEAVPEQAAPQEAPPVPDPPVATVEPPAPEAVPAPPQDPVPPPPEAPAATAEAEQPRPEDLPLPAPPAPAPPQREAALTAPPRPAPPPSNRLPGLFVPDLRLGPPGPAAPPSPRQPQRRGLDLSPGAIELPGRESPDAQLSIKGAQVGPNWLSAFRRWVQEHVRYPEASAVLNEKGVSTVELVVDPDGRVRGLRLVRRSGSVWLDHGTVMPFRNAVLPPFPPGADPDGVVMNLTIYWVGSR